MKLKIIIIILFVFCASAKSQNQISISIEEALDLSLSANPSLIAAEARTRASQAEVKQATGNFLPQLILNAGYTKYQEPYTITPIHEIGVFPALDDEIYNANLNLTLPVFDGGRRWSSRKVAKASEKENLANKQLVKQTLIQQVAELFLFAQQIEEQSQLIYKRLESLHHRYNDLIALEEEGRIPPGDVALVASTVASTQSDSISIAISKKQVALRLGLLTGKFQPVIPDLSSIKTTSTDTVEKNLEFAPIQTEITGPVLKAAIAQQQKSQAVSSIAKRSFWPEISLFGSYIYRSGTGWDPIGEWMTGIKVSLPLFQGGNRINKIQEAKALAKASVQAVKNAQLEQNTNLRIAYDEYTSSRERFLLLHQAEKEKIKSVMAQNELYKAGRIPLRDLNVQELELLQLQFDKNKMLFSAKSALLRYEMTAGILTKEKAILIAGGIK